jgi:hypothetical protein
MIAWWKSGCLPAVLIMLFLILGIGSCDYTLTKSALTDLRGTEPKPTTVIWVILNRDSVRARVKR